MICLLKLLVGKFNEKKNYNKKKHNNQQVNEVKKLSTVEWYFMEKDVKNFIIAMMVHVIYVLMCFMVNGKPIIY